MGKRVKVGWDERTGKGRIIGKSGRQGELAYCFAKMKTVAERDRSTGSKLLTRPELDAGLRQKPLEGDFAGAVPVLLVLLHHAIGDPVAGPHGFEFLFQVGPAGPGMVRSLTTTPSGRLPCAPARVDRYCSRAFPGVSEIQAGRLAAAIRSRRFCDSGSSAMVTL